MTWFSWFWDLVSLLGIYQNKTGRILLLGLDNAGKTTLVYRLSSGKVQAHRPTYMPNAEVLEIGGVTLKMIDLGGHYEARRLWTEYAPGVDGVVFVVDAADTDRLPEAKRELDKLLRSEELNKVPFAIIGNKIDLPNALPEGELAQRLDVTAMTTGKQQDGSKRTAVPAGSRPMEVFMSSTVRGVGFGDAFRWLAAHLP